MVIDLAVDFGISGHYVTRVLDQAARFRGYPKAIRTDQGPEFTGKAHAERVHRALHRVLSGFLIAAWCRGYNQRRPHSALNYQTPAEFTAEHRAMTSDQPTAEKCL